MADHVTGRTVGYDREKMLWMFDPITGCLLDLDGANSVATSFETDHTFDMARKWLGTGRGWLQTSTRLPSCPAGWPELGCASRERNNFVCRG